jgi:hypothetical protein
MTGTSRYSYTASGFGFVVDSDYLVNLDFLVDLDKA